MAQGTCWLTLSIALSVGMAAPHTASAPFASQASSDELPGRCSEPAATKLHPAGLANLIDEVGGRCVLLVRARVLAVVNPRAILIESASPLRPMVGNLDRVLVLVDAGSLQADGASVVGATVRVLGRARTRLGLEVSGEVLWPSELTRAVSDRLEIRAAVLASSVQTADGVELTKRP